MKASTARYVPLALLALLILACGASAPGSSPGVSPAPSPSPGGTPGATPGGSGGPLTVTSPAQAAALVFASNDRFAQIMPLQPDVIGQSAWYETTEAGDHYAVVVTIGSGDCMAGCIDRHTWTYRVDRDGTVSLVSEEGDQVDVPGDRGTDDPIAVTVGLTAGPTCPVEQDPPDPNCADRPVVNAEVVLRDPRGAEVARGVSDGQGLVVFSVPGGSYYVDPAQVDGVMGQAAPVAFAAVGGSSAMLTLTYDTGIR